MTFRAVVCPPLLAVLLLAGCATEKVDWHARLGHYTYDQAVKEYGPADRHEKLSDGTIVADWQVRDGQTIITPRPYLAPPDGLGPATPGYSSTYVPPYYMRLTFGPDGQLQAHKDFTR